jgi:hypothetical protein
VTCFRKRHFSTNKTSIWAPVLLHAPLEQGHDVDPKVASARHRATVEKDDGASDNFVGISYNYAIRFFDTIPKAKMERHHHFSMGKYRNKEMHKSS